MRVSIVVAVALMFVAFSSPAHAQSPRPDLESPGAVLRISLGRLMSEHVFLSAEAMRMTASGGDGQASATAALEENTAAIQAEIASIYGATEGSSFGDLWRRHIGHLLDYAAATRSGDQAARSQALAGLSQHGSALTAFLTGANPQIEPQALAEALHLHNEQLGALLEQDPAAAFETERQAYAQMFDVGDVLAAAFIDQFPSRFPGEESAFSPSVALWLTLSRLLGEHLILAAEAMRSSESEATLTAARDAANANTMDIAAAFESVYGVDAGASFRSLWDAHVQAYFAYIDAVRVGDATEQQARRDQLTAYSTEFGAFMANANPYLDADAVATMISHHTQALIYQVDAYSAGDHARAYAEVRQAHAHMFDIAKVFAAAFVGHHPELFELPDTSARADPSLAVPTPPGVMVFAWLVAMLMAVGLAVDSMVRPRVRP